MVDYIE